MNEAKSGSEPLDADISKDIGKEIVVSFHGQFAQNQNHHQKLFLQVLAVLLSVLAGFGYLYIRVNTKFPDTVIRIETLYFYLALSMALLSMAVSLICNMALGFRRDQLLAANIRVIANVMNPSNNDNYFFGSFNPQGKAGVLSWMPEFHSIFFISLLAVKPLLILSVVFYPSQPVTTVYSCSKGTVIGIAVLVLLSFVADCYSLLHYRRKWKVYSDKAPDRLRARSST